MGIPILLDLQYRYQQKTQIGTGTSISTTNNLELVSVREPVQVKNLVPSHSGPMLDIYWTNVEIFAKSEQPDHQGGLFWYQYYCVITY